MLSYKNSKLILQTNIERSGIITWQSPSNIAIIKYWGKYGIQLPRNPSLSLTLSNSKTVTKISYEIKKNYTPGLIKALLVNGEENDPFKLRMENYLSSLKEIFPFLHQLDLTIETNNSFPHSTGIASSASGFSALALCLCTLEEDLFNLKNTRQEFYQKASYLSRLGSGSASRSVFSFASVWGNSSEIPGSSNEFAVPVEDYIHPIFKTIHNDILIIDSKKKEVSSTAGHQLMENNPYAEARYSQANQRLKSLLRAMKSGDIVAYGELMEKEALTLHALMMASNPPFILIKPNTLDAISKIQDFRKSSGVQIYFTLDAGPNLHLQYLDEQKKEAQRFIKEDLLPLCEDKRFIQDNIGVGPELLIHEAIC